MKDRKELQRVFGEADPGFTDAIHRSLTAIKTKERERPMKKLSLGLVTALTCLLLATAAFAAARQWGVFDFLGDLFGKKVPPAAWQAIQRDDALARAETGEAVFNVREALFDGRTVYIVVAVTPKADDTLPLGVDSRPEDPAADLGPLAGGSELSIGEWAKQNGKSKFVHTGITSAGADGLALDSCSFVTEADGALVYMLSGAYRGDATEIDVQLSCLAAPFAPDGSIEIDRLEHAALAVPLTAASPDSVRSVAPATYASCGVRADQVTLTATPLALYFDVEYTVTDEAAFALTGRNVEFELLDAAGQRLPAGASLRGETYELPGSKGPRFVQSGSLEATQALPEKIVLRGYSRWDLDLSESHEIEVR